MNQPHNEYPRPQFERKEWINLNGEWSYAFDFSRSGGEKGWEAAECFEGKIKVPFCPESKLSGVGYTDFIEMMWYQRNVKIPIPWARKKILLHFGGVDYKCIIYVDGTEVGRHTGGISPFTIDLTKFVQAGGSHNLVLQVEDDLRSGLQAMGKQSPWHQSKGCSYTRTTGIWQTVWMEAVDPCALKTCRIVADYDNRAFSFIPTFHASRRGLRLTVSAYDQGNKVASSTVNANDSCAVTIKLAQPKEWNPETPFLYDIQYTLKDENGIVLDEVFSYAGLRKVHIEGDRFYLNNQPFFCRFVLDQGFYQDGLWTAPNDDALRQDIKLSMKAGFNGARLHQKIFAERFHYWADRMGYLTWAEFPDWGMSFWQHFRPTNPDYNLSFRDYFAEWSAVLERDMNHPSIVAWTPFNETQAFYDLEEHRRFIRDIYDLTRRLDPSRPVNDTSGYIHVKTDFWTIHTYAQTVEALAEQVNQEPVYIFKPDLETVAWNGQPYIVDEYGGVSYLPEGHKAFADNSWGYNRDKLSQEETEQRIVSLTKFLVTHPRVSGYCYTQLTDIEQEQNGIYNYDRTAKFDAKTIRDCFTMKPEWSRF